MNWGFLLALSVALAQVGQPGWRGALRDLGGPCDYLGGHLYLFLGHNEVVSSVFNDFFYK